MGTCKQWLQSFLMILSFFLNSMLSIASISSNWIDSYVNSTPVLPFHLFIQNSIGNINKNNLKFKQPSGVGIPDYSCSLRHTISKKFRDKIIFLAKKGDQQTKSSIKASVMRTISAFQHQVIRANLTFGCSGYCSYNILSDSNPTSSKTN